MNKPYLIRFEDNLAPRDTHFWLKLRRTGVRSSSGDSSQFFWDGTLQEWMDKWQSRFVFLPAEEKEKEFISGTILLDPYS